MAMDLESVPRVEPEDVWTDWRRGLAVFVTARL